MAGARRRGRGAHRRVLHGGGCKPRRDAITGGDLARLPRFPILARLAVDSRGQGQGLGTWLFDEALQRTLLLAAEGPIGFRVLATDAKNTRAATFYERRGLVALTDQWPRRMVLDLKPLVPRRSG